MILFVNYLQDLCGDDIRYMEKGGMNVSQDDKSLDKLFRVGESPYFSMYKAGYYGYSIEEVVSFLTKLNIPLREKDIRNWQAGAFKHQLYESVLNPFISENPSSLHRGKMFEDTDLEDFERFPDDWVSTEKRFFPCTEDNMPMTKWGWSSTFTPTLYTDSDARAISPSGWIGQNMLYQKFIVIDIDGVGHGETDPYVIAFGNMYKDKTMVMEDPNKVGSFHLYFETDRIIPIKHFPFAKLDLMGNAKNAAVYLKNKVSNGLPMAKLTNEVWHKLMSYINFRKENINES